MYPSISPSTNSSGAMKATSGMRLPAEPSPTKALRKRAMSEE